MALDKPENATAAKIVLKKLTGLDFESVQHDHDVFYAYRDEHLDIVITPAVGGWAWHDQDGRFAQGRDLKGLITAVAESVIEHMRPAASPWGVDVAPRGTLLDPELATRDEYAPVFINDTQARYLVRAMKHYTSRADNVKQYELDLFAHLDFRIAQARKEMR